MNEIIGMTTLMLNTPLSEEQEETVHTIRTSGDAISTIFDRFTQADTSTARKFGGTGLGLAISKQLAMLVGGEIGVRSVENQGSTFTVCIPFEIDTSKVSNETAKATELKATFSARVLVVEDNNVNQLVARRMLANLECEVDIANNGLEGVEKIQMGEYELVFMDCQMPEMDGFEATRTLRSEGINSLPIVAMTANVMAGDRERCLEAGMTDYVSKPISPIRLREILSLYTEKKPDD